MWSLPESPRWLYRENYVHEAKEILEKLYPEDEVDREIQALRESVESERAMEESIGKDMWSKLKGAFTDKVVRRGLYAGVTVQVAQQFVGINTVMYYSPTIVQFAGFASKSVALALSLITSGLNAVGSIISMMVVDKYGRRRLMIISMFGIISCLIILAVVFRQASLGAPGIDFVDTKHFGSNVTCPSYLENFHKPKWGCTQCLKAKCSFCSNVADKVTQNFDLIEIMNARQSTACSTRKVVRARSGSSPSSSWASTSSPIPRGWAQRRGSSTPRYTRFDTGAWEVGSPPWPTGRRICSSA
ncbi:unnamed protein product [Linum tenue]|uniref:Major facilitator superfamily (MFS) profile domain-containing protein n=1 Tax=Linum tenue TaxID=586396 RepID=A0AAV0GPS8_9ROSI|nr:unnamed protein product [Linum tenue]